MKKLLTILTAGWLFASCTSVEGELEKRINPVGFKGVLSGTSVSWNTGDTISISNASGSGLYRASGSGASALFTKISGEELTAGPFTATYPYDADRKVKVDSIQNGKPSEPRFFRAESSNTILLFKPMTGTLALTIDGGGMEISGFALTSGSSRYEVIPAPDATAPYIMTLLPEDLSGASIIVKTVNDRIFTVEVPSGTAIKAAEETALRFSLAACDEQDALLTDGPAAGAAIRKDASGMERLIIEVKSETASGTMLQSTLSRTPIYFNYDAGSKTGTISTLAPVIRTGSDMSSLFAEFGKLRTIEGLGNIRTERAEDFSSLFKGCSALEEVDLLGFDTAKATSLDSMFYGCSSLTHIDCSSFNVRNATGMRAMFAFCSSLDTLNIDNLETYSMTDGSYMFFKCTSLRKLSAAGLYSLNLEQDCSAMFFGDVNLGEMFFGANFYGAELDANGNLACDKDTPFGERLASAAGKLDIYCARSVAKAFAKSSLRWIRSGFEGSEPIPVTFFQDRFGLEGPSYDTITNVVWPSDIPDAFLPDGKELNLASKSLANGTSVTSTTTNAAAVKKIEFVTNADMSTISSGTDVSLFEDGMIIATFKDGVLRYSTSCDNFIATSSLDYMFDTYKNVRTITGLEKINVEKVTSASYMFNNCTSLDSLDLSTFAFTEVSSLKYMFNGCSSLRYLDIRNLTRVKSTGIQYMLYGTTALKTLRMDSFNNTWAYASYNQAFQGDSESTMIGAGATASDPCEVWTKNATHIVLMLSQNYSETYIHSSLMRKQFVNGKIRFRYPDRKNPWTVDCSADKLNSTPKAPAN